MQNMRSSTFGQGRTRELHGADGSSCRRRRRGYGRLGTRLKHRTDRGERVCSPAVETGRGDRIPTGGGRTAATDRSSFTGGGDSRGQLATGAGVLGAARCCASPGSDDVA
jgi:hypothetical protein